MKSAAIRMEEIEGINMGEELELRVARIESDVQHIKADTADLRVELRRTNDKIDEIRDSLTARIDDVRDVLTGKFDGLAAKFDGLKDKLHSVTLWALLLYFALAGSLLTVMAKGFKWI